MRKPPQLMPRPASERTTVFPEERVFRFLSPVFGGGVRVPPAPDGAARTSRSAQREPDPCTPIRVPSIRGQLRFWWRACNPSKCTDVRSLLEAESSIFGSTPKLSLLRLAVVKGPGPARPVPVLKDRFAVVDQRLGRAYGAFPLRDTGQGTNHGVLYEYRGDWTIAVSYARDEFPEDVEAALWAWAHFGGLGGRTRRGFGAVAEVARSQGALETIDAGWERYVSGLDVPWPHLPTFEKRRLRIKSGTFPDGAAAQEYLLDTMRRLRQVEMGRRREPDDDPGRHPGRSYWPEPDTLRKLTSRRSRKHAKPVTSVEAFPRAAFGLPIIFHFKDSDDPPDCTLVPSVDGEEKSRLASPLILRPHRSPDGTIEALAVVLEHPPPDDLMALVKQQGQDPLRRRVSQDMGRQRAWALTKSEAVGLGLGGRPSPLVTANGGVVTDPIDRFLEEIR